MSSSIKMTLLRHLSGLSIPSDTLLNFFCQKSPLLSSSQTQVQLLPSLKWVSLFHHFHSILGRQLNKWWMRNWTFAKFRSNSGSISMHFRGGVGWGVSLFCWGGLCGVCFGAFVWVRGFVAVVLFGCLLGFLFVLKSCLSWFTQP